MKFSLFTYHTGILYGVTSAITSVTPDRGPSIGGQDFVILGDGFQYTTYDDQFTAGTLLPFLWTDSSNGTGTVTTGVNHLQLSSGVFPGSLALVEMQTNTILDSQFEVRVNIPPVSVNPASTVTLFGYQAYSNANTHSTILVELDNAGVITLRCQVYKNTYLVDDYSVPWTTGVSTFKILRWGTDVYFYTNGYLQFRSVKGYALAAIYRMFVDNRATTYDVYQTNVEYFRNKPFAVFGNEVVHDLVVVGMTRVRGVTPPSLDRKGQSAAYAGIVDVSVVSDVTTSKRSAYEYYYLDSLTLLNETQFGMKVSAIDDLTIRTPATESRGLGGGK
jgi:hypothetical protein